MSDEKDSLYKRVDDNEWRDRVNDRLSSLTAGETVQNDRLDALHEKLEELHHLLEGMPDDRDDNGLKGDVKELLALVGRVNSVLSLDITGNPGYDRTGKPGYLKKIDLLWDGEERADRRSDRRWRGAVPIILGILSLAGAIFASFDKLERFFQHKQKKDPLEQMIERAKRPKARHRHVVIQEEPEPEEPTEN